MSRSNPFLKRYKRLAQDEYNAKIKQAAEAAPELERKSKAAMAKILGRRGGVFDLFVERFDSGQNLERDFAEYAAFLERISERLFEEFEAQRGDNAKVVKLEPVEKKIPETAKQTVETVVKPETVVASSVNESVTKPVEAPKTAAPVKNENVPQQGANNNTRSNTMMAAFLGDAAEKKPDWMAAFD